MVWREGHYTAAIVYRKAPYLESEDWEFAT